AISPWKKVHRSMLASSSLVPWRSTCAEERRSRAQIAFAPHSDCQVERRSTGWIQGKPKTLGIRTHQQQTVRSIAMSDQVLSSGFKCVDKNHPCGICGKVGWLCRYTEDGAVQDCYRGGDPGAIE